MIRRVSAVLPILLLIRVNVLSVIIAPIPQKYANIYIFRANYGGKNPRTASISAKLTRLCGQPYIRISPFFLKNSAYFRKNTPIFYFFRRNVKTQISAKLPRSALRCLRGQAGRGGWGRGLGRFNSLPVRGRRRGCERIPPELRQRHPSRQSLGDSAAATPVGGPAWRRRFRTFSFRLREMMSGMTMFFAAGDLVMRRRASHAQERRHEGV